MCKVPKLLILNEQSSYKKNATGITLRSIIASYPNEQILELYIDSRDQNEAKNSDHKSMCVIDSFPIQKIIRNYGSKKQKSINKKIVNTKKNDFKSKLKRVIINLNDISPMKNNESLYTELEKFKPDVIYTLGASVAVMKQAIAISRKFDIPIVVHFMDDWPHFLQNEKGITNKIYKKILRKWLNKTYKNMSIGLGISPQMCENYEKETGIEHIPLMNSVDINQFYTPHKIDKSPFIITYAGGLHLDRWKALIEIKNVIGSLNQNRNKKIELHLYTNADETEEVLSNFKEPFVKLFKYVNHNEIQKIYATSNALVHTETSNELLLNYFRFSISTKIPEYLATNRPVLFYGPDEMGLYDYLNNNNIAFVASNVSQLKDSISNMIDEDEISRNVCENAIGFAWKHHDQKKIANIFIHTLNKSIDKWRGGKTYEK